MSAAASTTGLLPTLPHKYQLYVQRKADIPAEQASSLHPPARQVSEVSAECYGGRRGRRVSKKI
jgi:hypothetical protein